MTERKRILDEACALVHGDRNTHYGHPTVNFDRIAALWTVLLDDKLVEGATLEPHDVADLMVAMKLARNMEWPRRDNYVDIAGYAACGWEACLPVTEGSNECE